MPQMRPTGWVRLARPLRAVWRISRLLGQLLLGMAVMALRFPSLDAAGRQARIGGWSAGVLQVLGVTLRASGTAQPGACLLLANHVSWLDIAALHAVVPQARFVSKSDVLRWPLLGWLIRGAGTLFIERERKRDALRVVHTVAQALRDGQTVAVFPEGTTGAGPVPLPFHANLLQAAISTDSRVQLAVLRFADAHQRFSPAADYVGDTSLLQSMWRIALAQGLVVHLDLLPAQPTTGTQRRPLAEALRQQVIDHLAG